MSDLTTCKHCGDSMRAKGSKNMMRAFCSSLCAGDHRRELSAARRADQEARAEAKVAYNAAGLENYMSRMRASAERQRRLAAVRVP